MSGRKIYHTIGQVSEFLDLPQSVLRYWETVFEQFNPHKSPGGNRLYTDEDIKLIKRIKELLYEQKFTIKGANGQLMKEFNNVVQQDSISNNIADTQADNNLQKSDGLPIEEVKEIVDELNKLIKFLDD